ncbi:MAG: NAD-glutamate dehydrogenase [Rhizobiales bacterium]|nr:NAD-glutamate dehydrogenase [Hyphomicrobiales bacterium]
MGAVVGVAHAYPRAEFMGASRRLWHEQYGSECGDPGNSFFSQIYDDALAEDLEQVSAEELAQLGLSFWDYGETRNNDAILIRVRTATRPDGSELPRDVLEIISRDRPFLVDSIMGEIGAQGHDIVAMFHPIVQTRRADNGQRVLSGGNCVAESMIQVHLPPLDELSRRTLIDGVSETLNEVRVSVEDWSDMRAQMDEAIAHLEQAVTHTSAEELTESIAFLRWLRDDHFAFLGCRVYEFNVAEDGSMVDRQSSVSPDTGRGVLRDPDCHVLRKGSEPAVLTPEIESFLREPNPIIVAKANMKSRVHRRVYMDYVGVKRYRADGAVIGEARFVGLFTAEAYDQSASKVPLIRRKVRRVLERAGKTPGTHNAKKLRNTVENFPRDELFQMEENDLLEIGLGILHLHDRPRTKLFFRRDQFDRFVSALLYVPRDRYNSKVRESAGELIREAFGGRLSAYYPKFGDSPLARVHYIIGLNPFDHPEPDISDLERRVARLARTWEDDFETHVRRTADNEIRLRMPAYQDAFKAGYRELYEPDEALQDIIKLESLDTPDKIAVRVYREADDKQTELRLKIYRVGNPVSLSGVMPILENLGLHVVQETGFPVDRRSADGKAQDRAFVHDFELETDALLSRTLEEITPVLEEALLAVIEGNTEDDGFNRLILDIGVSWRETAFLRTCARYRQQTGLDPSQAIQEEALSSNSDIALQLLDLVRIKFDPEFGGTMDDRRKAAETAGESISQKLESVASLDHDRVLRRMFRLIESVLRTNFFQSEDDGSQKARISIKIASGQLEELPLPKPYREIFVWAPDVEGVHIRFGPVARGGLRWSDRRDDFRTEVLGLVKAQQVKNAVIVPVGSKGGFYPKKLPKSGNRDEVFHAGREAYKTFIRGLLDITDNIVDEAVCGPASTICWDDDDPYLVVAADKGTATFSDTANGLAEDEYDFWLGDAFASGGSAGYDHKKMGITARGAWESVKRHFREMGKDIQSEPFTVIGVGDMSGDVFGNGMLLSRQIRLVAAFDHRDIFIDPEPGDPGQMWDERKRLFDTPRTSWQDYDTSLISKGGGVFPRSAKTIKITEEIKRLTGLEKTRVSPLELMNALLKVKTELLWFGGIGTYVKATHEQHWEVGDKTNDALRLDATEVGASVIGEGANLGFTQAARIEFAREGGRLNGDFVDNSAGVDSSDHEVNIKILLRPMMQSGDMEREDRDKLLASMTDDVAEHVLAHNYTQTLTLSLAEATAQGDMDAYGRFMDQLEAEDRLDREVEDLPDADEVATRFENGPGMTRPEMATLMAYAKNTLVEDLVAGTSVDDPHFTTMLRQYFPKGVHEFKDERSSHRLHREIVATILANDMIDRGGPTFPYRLCGSAGVSPDVGALCFEGVRQLYGYEQLVSETNKLDNKISSEAIYSAHFEIMSVLRRQTYWVARRPNMIKDGLGSMLDAYSDGVREMSTNVDKFLSQYEVDKSAARNQILLDLGVPKSLATKISRLRTLISASDIIDLASKENWPLLSVASLYHGFGDVFWFDRLRGAASTLEANDHWDRLAVRRLIEDFYRAQQRLTRAAMSHITLLSGNLGEGIKKPSREWRDKALTSFIEVNAQVVEHTQSALEELDKGNWTLAKLAIANTQMRELSVIAVS